LGFFFSNNLKTLKLLQNLAYLPSKFRTIYNQIFNSSPPHRPLQKLLLPATYCKQDNMGIICSTDDTQNWTKTFKGNEAEDPYNNVSFSEPAPSNPYDQGPRPSLLTSNYYPPPQTTSNAANEARGASAHPRAY
jgi:hypothetical protein